MITILIKAYCVNNVVDIKPIYLNKRYSPFRLTSLIYAEKFEFQNAAIMEDEKCKQTERFSVMTKGKDYFLSLDDKSKYRYKVKINDIQWYELYQIKKEELSGDISKFLAVQ